jgi:membrane-bound lytic murein transglycosylase A
LARKADINARVWLSGLLAACALLAVCFLSSYGFAARRHVHAFRRPPPETSEIHRPQPEFPFEIPGTQYSPLNWADVAGWLDDDQLAAFQAFRASCAPILAQTKPPSDDRVLGVSLREPCRVAKASDISTIAAARAFFEAQFRPLRISRLGEDEGFVTGYYEPIVDGSRTQTDVYNVPVYRRPSNLFVRGFNQASESLPNKGAVYRKIGRRKLVPYYDRGEIEDGAIAGRGLELCWLKNQTDLLFMQIQGSARIRFDDGSMLRINYDAHNGYPYTAVGRILIDRNIIPKDQMSMQRIRQWMDENPDGAKELRRQNRAYVFFRQVTLAATEEAIGAQGVHLTAGRSVAVDKSLHVYGTPFFIAGKLPIESEQSTTPFGRLMVAQDTGSAIVGPARADLYFGAGAEAGRVSGRLRHGAQFVMLVPNSLDPVVRGRTMLLPEERPSKTIAKLFPQHDVAPKENSPKESSAKDAASKTVTGQSTVSGTAKDQPVQTPSPQASSPQASSPQAVPQAAVPSSPSGSDVKTADAKPQAVPMPAPRPEAAGTVSDRRSSRGRRRHRVR